MINSKVVNTADDNKMINIACTSSEGKIYYLFSFVNIMRMDGKFLEEKVYS